MNVREGMGVIVKMRALGRTGGQVSSCCLGALMSDDGCGGA
ncbi:hypothetical protein [Streptomyces scopuliridis]